MNVKLTQQDLDEITRKYYLKTSIKILAKEYNCCNTTMSKILKSIGIMPSKKGYASIRRFSNDKELEIISLYQKGLNQKEIALKYNTFNTSIRRVLLRHNIPIRSTFKTQRLCKHNPFRKYSKHDEYTEYFLGLLLTDGCITKELNSTRISGINLSLNSSDRYIVEKFRDWASPNQKISTVKQSLNNSYMCSITIANEEASEWLYRKGNFKNKSYQCKIYCPITWSILRGIFDGDGGFCTINKNGLKFFICSASEIFISQINNFLLNQGIKSKFNYEEPSKWHKNGIYYVSVYNYIDVIKIGLNMYSNAHIFLIRKYEKWLTFYESIKKKYTLNSVKDWHSNTEQNLPTQEVINKLGRDVQRL